MSDRLQPMDCSTPGFHVHHQLLELVQTPVHWVSDTIQPSHPLSSPSPPAPNPSQHQRLFQWVNSSHEVAKVLELQLQHQSFQCTFRTDFLYDGLVWSPCSPRDSQESSPTSQFKSINSSVLSFLYGPTLTSMHDYWKNQSFVCMDLCQQDNVSAFEYVIRLVIAFLPRSKCLLTLWLQLWCAVILEPKKIKSVTISTVSPSTCHEVMGPDAIMLIFWLEFKARFFTLLFHFHQDAF